MFDTAALPICSVFLDGRQSVESAVRKATDSDGSSQLERLKPEDFGGSSPLAHLKHEISSTVFCWRRRRKML